MDFLKDLLSNGVLISALLSWFISQLIKTVHTLFTTRKVNFERLVGAGGMPSSHSALVCSMCTAIARVLGAASVEFALAVAFASIVMYDAMGVRRAAGEHAKILNKIVFKISLTPEEQNESSEEMLTNKELKEFLGHTPMQVVMGALLGIVIGLLYPL